MRRALGLAATLACAAPATAQTAFDGRIVECFNDQESALLGGRYGVRYAFYGDGTVGVTVAQGAMRCEEAGRLPRFTLGEPTASTLRCARTGSYDGRPERVIEIFGQSVATIAVEGREIRIGDVLTFETRIDGALSEARYTSETTIICDTARCRGFFVGTNGDGGSWSGSLSCDILALGAS